MSLHICPRCNQRYIVDNNVGDYIHNCNSGNLALDQEDITIIGNWEDYDGIGTKPAQAVLMQGVENQLQGTRAEIEGENKEGVTRRGQRASTHRQRQHLQFIDLKENK